MSDSFHIFVFGFLVKATKRPKIGCVIFISMCSVFQKIFFRENVDFLKFIYSEKATKFCKMSILILTMCTAVKSKVEILQNFVAFSEYMNFEKVGGRSKCFEKNTTFMDGPQEANSGATNDLGVNIVDQDKNIHIFQSRDIST